jgi:CheY-like chemotaxis protein
MQVDAGQSSQSKCRSTGLGLAISRRLAIAHCGSIGVRSRPGSGSVFFLRIPAAVLPPVTIPKEISAIESVPDVNTHSTSLYALDTMTSARSSESLLSPTSRGGVVRLLLVDDSSVNKRMLLRSLQQAMPAVIFEVTDASDGSEGLRIALGSACARPQGIYSDESMSLDYQRGESTFDVCLCDGEMPKMNGYEMVSALRRAGSALPVIGVTGNALPADVQRFLDAGAQAVVTKPVRIQQLVQTIRSQISWL